MPTRAGLRLQLIGIERMLKELAALGAEAADAGEAHRRWKTLGMERERLTLALGEASRLGAAPPRRPAPGG
jgi:hypothetical protein